jgi:N-acyl-phosphatidylethanolamine-hydrolysing phospholipase D
MTNPAALGAVPEDSTAKAHHLKDGKGFTNPWESWKEMTGPQVWRALIWYMINI